MIKFDCDLDLPFMECCNDCEDCDYLFRDDVCGSDLFNLPICES